MVATVRGTAFGVSSDTDGVDVQVAEHQVEVVDKNAEEKGDVAKNSILLQANHGLKIKTNSFGTPSAVRRLVRSLSPAEKASIGFKFGIKRLEVERLRRPIKVVPLLKLPNLPEAFRSRVDFLHKRENIRRDVIRFGAPSTTPDLNPGTDPSATGSGGANIKTDATLFLNGEPL